MTVIETDRLTLRHLTPDDAPFMLRQLNEPSFHQFIGDRGVRTLEQARDYLVKGAIASYQQNGFGLNAVVLKASGATIGIAGLIRRPGLDDVDIGYALLPAYWGQGYAFEATQAVLRHGRETLGIQRIIAIVSPGNTASIRLLQKLGLRFERMIRMAEGEEEIELHA